MGIQYLKTFINEQSKKNQKIKLDVNSTLCIDGNGWAYYLYQNLERKYGGDYKKF